MKTGIIISFVTIPLLLVANVFADPFKSQVIDFTPIPQKLVTDADFNLSANTNSNLPIIFSTTNTSCTVTQTGLVHIVSVGTCTIMTSQAGDETFFSASTTRDLVIILRPDNTPTVSDIDFGNTNENTNLSGTLKGGDFDNDQLTFVIVSQPAHGQIINLSTTSLFNSQFTYVPNNNFFGTDTFTFKANDGVLDSNISTGTISVNHINQPPQINLVGSSTMTMTITIGDFFIDPGAIAIDPENGDLTAAISHTTNLNANTLGNYSVVYSVTDLGGLTATTSRTINVIDFPAAQTIPNTLPSITLLGANPYSLLLGTSFVDPGATATDTEDGNLTKNISATGTINTSVVGNYNWIYSVTDSVGSTTVATRTISVYQPVVTSTVSGGGGGGSYIYIPPTTATSSATSTKVILNNSVGIVLGASTTASTTDLTKIIPTDFKFLVSFGIGSDHKDVKLLQNLLVAFGYMKGGTPNGHFGPVTLKALKKFQLDNNLLPNTGYFGPKTRAFFNK